jgi:hypothetical protein
MLIWYTYATDGKPVWYTAQGDVASIGTPWALLRHRWADGRKAGADTVGSVTLPLRDARERHARLRHRGARAAART